MPRVLSLLLACLLPLTAAASEAIPPACQIERLEAARAACLELSADRIDLGTQHRLHLLGVRAQAATAAEIADYERGLRLQYRRYRSDIASECRTEYRIEAALCRLAAARDRALAAEEQIRSAEAALGLSDPAGPVPRLEIRPLPGGRFEVDVLIDGILPY